MNPQNSVKTQNASSSTIENPSVTEHCGLTTLQVLLNSVSTSMKSLMNCEFSVGL